MVQGGAKVNKDIPPYITAGREPLSFAGVNSVGLRRRGFTNEQIYAIQDVYRILYQSEKNTTNAIERILKELPAGRELDEIVTFVKNSARGIIKGYDE